jgi:hypothetical protein
MLARLGVVKGKHDVFFGNPFTHEFSSDSVFGPVFFYPELAFAEANVNRHPAHPLSVLPANIHPNVVPVFFIDHKKGLDIGDRLAATKFDLLG